MVRPDGFEPPTTWFEDAYSKQRKYRENEAFWQLRLDRVPRRGVRVMDLGKVHSCSVDHCGQPSGLIVAQGLESFKLHVASLQLPLVVLLGQ
jgi:hypothetical protein